MNPINTLAPLPGPAPTRGSTAAEISCHLDPDRAFWPDGTFMQRQDDDEARSIAARCLPCSRFCISH